MNEYLDYLEKLNSLVDKDEILFKSAKAIVIKDRKRLWDWIFLVESTNRNFVNWRNDYEYDSILLSPSRHMGNTTCDWNDLCGVVGISYCSSK